MNPSAIYSKSGKGVQEASGKTSLLKRGDRAVLSAIDGRATLAEVAQKVGKPFDGAFEALITQLDKDGFVREVAAAAGSSTASGARPAATIKPPPKPAAARPAPSAAAPGEDLDFTTIMPAIKPGAAAPKAPPPAAHKPPPPAAAPAVDRDAAERAKAQESALHKARAEAEARAQAEKEKQRAEIEAKARAETEAKIRAETERKVREEAEARVRAEAEAKAEAKAKAAREAALKIAAEAKAKAEAEAQAKIEAERKAREEAERKAREEAEKARKEAEELRQRLEEERKAREAEEKKRREEEERRRKEEEARRAKEEAERKAREEAERKRREEEEARRRKQEEEERRRKEEEERERVRAAQEAKEKAAREAKEKAAREAKEAEERARKALEETKLRQPTIAPPPPPPPPPPVASDAPGSLDSLMADLDSFSQREEEERAARDAAERQSREDKKRKAKEEADRRAQEEAERERRAADERRRREEEERRAQEEAERRVREAEELRQREAEERKRQAREAMAAAAPAAPILEETTAAAPAAQDNDIGVTDDDLDMDDVRRDEAIVAKDARKAQREREREIKQREKEAKERARAAARAASSDAPVKYSKPRRPMKWGKPFAMTLFVLLVAGIGALHVVPLPMEDYEDAASEALGRPVRIASGRLSLFTGVRLNLEGVRIGDSVRIAEVAAYPRFGSLIDENKAFRRIELQGVTIPQQALSDTLTSKIGGKRFSVGRIIVTQLKLEGPMPLPPLSADAVLGTDGAVRSVTLSGPDELNIKLTPAGNNVEFDATASSFTLPFAQEVSLGSFAMKGVATRQGMTVQGWGGSLYDGALSGTANVRWGTNWQIDGVVSARNINAAVFAPALLSRGKAEGTGKFTLSGADAAKLANGARVAGNFTVNDGVLGSFDLSRAIQSSGRQYAGTTRFVELTGQGVYDRGAVALRNIIISAGALNAGASADIAQTGTLNGRIVADVKVASTSMRQTLEIGGTVREPQVRN